MPILTNRDRQIVASERRRQRRNADIITVASYQRPQYRLTDIEAARIARWEDVDTAMRRLLKHRNKEGPVSFDDRRALELNHLIKDNFNVR
jgi:hypothetical protein